MEYDEKYSKWKNWNIFGEIPKEEKLFFDKYVKANLNQSAPIRILEIGYGNGSFLRYGSKLGWEMLGTEVNQNLLKLARENNYKVFEGNEYETLGENHFECVCAFDVLEHLDQKALEKLFRNVKKLLKPGGLFIARFPNGDSPFGLYNQNGDFTHISFLGTVAISSLCKTAEYESLKINGQKKVNGKSGVLYFLYHYIAVAIIKVLSLAISFLFPQFKDDKFFSPNLVMVAQKSLND